MKITFARPWHSSTERSGMRRFLFVAVCALSIVGLAQSCAAQQVTGTIAGTIKDGQGALVTTATVKATNIDTGFTRSVPSDSLGSFNIPYLPVGRYTVEVNAAGFKKFVQKNLALNVEQVLALSVVLDIGTIDQTITVTEAPPLVNVTTAELGRTVDPVEIISLPLVNRNAYAEVSLTPGVQSNSASGASNPSGTPNFQFGQPSTQIIVNGGIDEGTAMVSFYLDGGINMTSMRNYGNPLPNPDALQEFRVETNNFAAQYGRLSGAVVTAVTKSGTNQIHGSLFEFNRNTDLNAYQWNATTKQPYHRNQFGVTTGGPIRHDKVFFFGTYAGLRQTVGQQLTGGIVPTALERLGDFTQSKVIPNMPGTKTPVSGVNTSSNCGTAKTGCIPSSVLDSTAANIISKYIPLPNSTNNTWSGYFTGPTNQDEFLGKYDQVLSDKDHITLSYFYLNTTQDAYGSGNFPYSINRSYGKQQNVNISDIHSFGTSIANQAWLTFTRVAGGRVNMPEVSLGDLGSSFTIQGPKALPALSVSGYFSAGGSVAGPVTNTNFFALRDVITMTKGKHTLNYGFEGSLDQDIANATLVSFGSFSFATSAPTTTGNALADFVTGQVSSMEQDIPYTSRTATWFYGFFLQDSYRIQPRMTINLGLRYDLATPPVEAHDRLVAWVPNVQSTVVPSAPLGMLFPGDNGIPRGIVDLRKHHLSPRVGLVWDPFGSGKTAVRAGAGVFYGGVSGNTWNQPTAAQPFCVRQTFNSITSLTNIYGNTASFPTGDPFPYYYSAKSPRFLPAANIEAIAKDFQWPFTYQMNLAIEQQLPQNMSLMAAYVGSLTHRIPFTTDVNYPAWAAGATTSQTSINARRPYEPGVLGQIQYDNSTQNSSYHSFQISVRRPLTRNLMLNGFYVFSHSLETANGSAIGISAPQDCFALWEERGLTDYDRRHVATISGMWKIDYFKGSNNILKQIVNGWSISPIYSLFSGLPVTITTGSDKNADSYSSDRPNLVAGTSAFLDSHRDRKTAAAQWFNIAAFTANGPGLGIGVGGADGNTPRDSLRAPGYRDIDLGILRDFQFERGISLQLRGEATNAFNLVSLSAPTASLSSSINGKITSAYTPRVIQVGARLTF